MLYVSSDSTIQLTRGDTARLSVSILNDLTNSEYIIGEKDTLRLTVKKSVNDVTPVFQKVVKGSNQFYIEPSDTKDISFGRYLYDVELTTASEDVYTVIVPTTFEILKEVTY